MSGFFCCGTGKSDHGFQFAGDLPEGFTCPKCDQDDRDRERLADAIAVRLGAGSTSEIEFVDAVGHPGKLKLKNGVWCFDGVITN